MTNERGLALAVLHLWAAPRTVIDYLRSGTDREAALASLNDAGRQDNESAEAARLAAKYAILIDETGVNITDVSEEFARALAWKATEEAKNDGVIGERVDDIWICVKDVAWT